MKGFLATIFAMGVTRFVLTIAGLPDGIVKYFSMTVIIMAGTLYFAIATSTHKERLKASYLLIFPYLIVEVAALGYTWASGRQTIFHSADYSLGFSIAAHTLGHLVGGLSWEPLTLFALMEIIWGIVMLVRKGLAALTGTWKSVKEIVMKVRLLSLLGCLALLGVTGATASAQLAPPNTAGVSLGAVYFTVPNVEAHRKIWVDIFGAKPVKIGATEMLKMPGVFIVLTKGAPAAGDALVNHLGIWAKDLDPVRAKLTAAGLQTAPKAPFVNLPDGLRLEFIDDPNGPDAPAAHHIHCFISMSTDAKAARAWYMTTFGATENSRRNGGVPSALFTTPDKWISVDFTQNGNPTPNKGKILDRFALEVKNLDAFVKKIEAGGVKITKPVATNPDGLKTAMIVDVLGNEVELIEGLAGK